MEVYRISDTLRAAMEKAGISLEIFNPPILAKREDQITSGGTITVPIDYSGKNTSATKIPEFGKLKEILGNLDCDGICLHYMGAQLGAGVLTFQCLVEKKTINPPPVVKPPPPEKVVDVDVKIEKDTEKKEPEGKAATTQGGRNRHGRTKKAEVNDG